MCYLSVCSLSMSVVGEQKSISFLPHISITGHQRPLFLALFRTRNQCRRDLAIGQFHGELALVYFVWFYWPGQEKQNNCVIFSSIVNGRQCRKDCSHQNKSRWVLQRYVDDHPRQTDVKILRCFLLGSRCDVTSAKTDQSSTTRIEFHGKDAPLTKWMWNRSCFRFRSPLSNVWLNWKDVSLVKWVSRYSRC